MAHIPLQRADQSGTEYHPVLFKNFLSLFEKQQQKFKTAACTKTALTTVALSPLQLAIQHASAGTHRRPTFIRLQISATFPIIRLKNLAINAGKLDRLIV